MKTAAPLESGLATAPASALRHLTLPRWAPLAALWAGLLLAWLNFLLTAKWASLPGALHGPRKPWYALALVAATVLAIARRREVGREIRLGGTAAATLLVVGTAVILAALFARLPVSSWPLIPFKDDWTPLYQVAVNGVHLLRRGAVVGWNWWMMGGYPTSTDIAQSLAALAFVPMTLFGEQVGYHVLHVALFLAVPVFVWWDMRQEGRELGIVAAGLACLFAAGYQGPLGGSGDTNSLAGVFSAGAALVGSRAARAGRAWGGAVLILGLASGLYSHTAFFVYALVYLVVEAIYFRDRVAAVRLAAAAAIAGVVALPIYWESLRYPAYVSFNNVAYEPGAPTDWAGALRSLYYNVEILAFPHRWFNDYRSLANVWLPALAVVAVAPGRSRAGFYAWAALVTQALLRLNTPEAGALFDRIQHMFPLLAAPALAGFVLRFAGTRALAMALLAVLGLYVQTSFAPIRHVPDLRSFDPAFVDRVASLDGNLVLVEVSPHRDMDSDPLRRTPKPPWDVHFEGLLPGVAGQRFYSQMFDGWVWNTFRGEVVGAGTFRGRAIAETPIEDFSAEMRRWGVRHLLVWTDASRTYLADSNGRFIESWRSGHWSHFEMPQADVRSATSANGTARLAELDLLGAAVELTDVLAGDLVVVRTHYYPAWRASAGASRVPLFDSGGQLAFLAPQSGTYTVRLEYPRYRGFSVLAVIALALGCWVLSRRPRNLPPGQASTESTTL